MTEPAREANLDDVFRPPAGGDITLRSNDGVEFLVHSMILGVASSVFEGLLRVGTKKDVVELSENAETLSLALRFIYPNKKAPIITNFDTLSLCLQAAQKYDLEGMLETIDDQIATRPIPQSLLHKDPLRACELALQFNLPETRALAMPLAITGKINFSDPSQLEKLVKSHSSITVARLAAIQSTRARMLADILLRFYDAPITPQPVHSDMLYELSCGNCRQWMASSEIRPKAPPSWLLAWADLAYQTLLVTALEGSDELFDWSILENLKGKKGVCRRCLDDFQAILSQQNTFNEWANGVRNTLKQRLESLQHLHNMWV